MGLEELRSEILRRTSEEVKRLEAEAKVEEEKILGEADAERKRELEAAKAEAAQAARDERNERLAAARLAAMRMRAEAKEEAIEKALEKVLEEFEGMRGGGSYPDFLKKLIEQGMREIGKDAVVQLSREDQKLAKGWKLKVDSEPAEIDGGAIISSSDGRVKIRNTLRELFEQQRDFARKEVNAELFGAEAGA